jgi:hypothetical protein
MTKRKCMEDSKTTKEKCNRIKNRDIEKVNQFKYVRSKINNNNNISSAINHKINKGKKCHFGLRNLLGLKAATERCKV